MVDQLNPSQQPPQPLDAPSNPQRLDALLASGEPRIAQVVQINLQLPSAQNPAPAATTLATSPALGATVATTAPPTGSATATPGATTTTATAAPAVNATAAANPATQAEVYKVQIRLEGRLYELLTTKPLDPGSSIQISRGGDHRITLQPLPAPAPGSQPGPQPATAEPPKAAAGSTATQPQSPLVRIATSAAPTYTPATLSSRPAVQPTAPAVAPESSANPPVGSKPAAPNPTIERVAVPLPNSQLSVRMGPGERLDALVISSRPAPALVRPPASPAAGQPMAALSTHQAQPAAALKTDPGSHQIRIALQQGSTLEFISPRPLPPGTQVQLVRDNQSQLWAELPTAQTRALEQALREHLPQQQPPSALLNLLSAAQTSGQLQQAKPLLLSLFQVLLGRSLTSPLQTDAASVRQQVQNSGTLLESKLARSNTQNINIDHKAILLKVHRNLSQAGQQRELPAALSERIHALTQQALSRVLVNQITSLGTQTQEAGNEQNRALVLDIPVAWQGKTENLQLKIERDPRGEDEAAATMLYRWQVRLNFEVDERRLLEAELTLEAEQISILWSGDPELRQRIEAQLDQLQQRLESIGLRVKTLGVRELLPETGNTPKPPRNQLIDIKT